MENREYGGEGMNALIARLLDRLEALEDIRGAQAGGETIDLYLNGRLVSRALQEDAARAQSRLERRVAMGVGR